MVFADADDFFYEGAFDELDKFVGTDWEVIFFLSDSRDGVTLERIEDRRPQIRQDIEKRNYIGLRFQSLVPWGKMIRRSVISENEIWFDEIEVSNDVMFSVKLGAVAQKVEVLNLPLYCCTRNSNSLVFHKTISRMKKRVRVFKRANDFLYNHQLDEYRILFSSNAYWYVRYFFPKHPFLMAWGIWTARYKGHTWEYVKEICWLSKNFIGNKLGLQK